MMFIKDILFCKCGSRQEQIILVIGMGVMVLVCAGICKFGYGMGQAALETVHEMDGGGSRRSGGAGRFVFYGYTIFTISGFLGVVFALMGVINLIRFLTGTGIEDPDEAW